jgi:predicted ATP-grasp superfamily ATP-dependent carboligase
MKQATSDPVSANAQAMARPRLTEGIGALVIGGDHPGLAIARSLGKRGIPVYILEDQLSISSYSRYVSRVLRAKDLRNAQKTVDSVLEAGHRHGLRDWVLFPTRDETVMAFSLHRERLTEFFRVTTPVWDTTRWAWDKRNTYWLAEHLGIPAPRTRTLQSLDELPSLYSQLPLAIKPAIKENFFYATGAKAWRADTAGQLRRLFRAAARKIESSEIMIQEIIPGDGDCQVSYCTFFRDGASHSSLVAKRMRQHPREFGRAATYVETVDLPEVEELGERFLKAIDFYGIAEIEFKRDPRDGRYKILDVNARAWGFHALGQAAGVDFPYLLFADQLGCPVEPCRGRSGVGWLRLMTDCPVTLVEVLRGRMSLHSYIQSIRRTEVESVFCPTDPLPSAIEFALLPYFVTKKLL